MIKNSPFSLFLVLNIAVSEGTARTIMKKLTYGHGGGGRWSTKTKYSCKGNLNEKIHARQVPPRSIHALAWKNHIKEILTKRTAFSCCSKTCSITGEKRKKLSLCIYDCSRFFFPMIPAIIFIKMDDTLYNCVVYFCLNENSVNHLIKTKVLPSCSGKEEGSPFMKPDNDSYGEAPRA